MTAQFHENLILNGERTSMAFCPPLPSHHPRVVELTDREIDARRKEERTAAGEEVAVSLADWFTGVLRIPRGAQLVYVHMGFGSVYEEEVHIHVERGRVTGTRVYDNRGKENDTYRLGNDNLPGRENRFPGDRDFN